MTKRLISYFHILLILPLIPLIQGCPNCAQDFVVDVLDVHWFVTDEARVRESPFDRRTLQLGGYFQLDESFAQSTQPNPFLSSALATSCPTRIIPNTALASIRITQEGIDITDSFLADTYENVLYVEIDEYLESERDGIFVVHTEVPEQDSLTWIITTELRNEQVFLDTLTFHLR